ncbi:MAG: HAD family hydrolase [Coprococcus sp.]|nr:HAD family hydrolase [Coprococcus sp.]
MDGVIFDVDGTLWDSTDVVAKAWNKAIMDNSNLKTAITGDTLKSLFGKTMHEITSALMPSLPFEEQTRIGYLCFDLENEMLRKEPGILYPGVRETFAALSKKTRLFIVSNCQCDYIEIFLETMGLTSYVTDHLCYGQTQTPKDETIALLMERNHLSQAVYVGDTQGDYDSCQKAGLPFIWAGYGFGNVPDANFRISGMEELLPLLTQMNAFV